MKCFDCLIGLLRWEVFVIRTIRSTDRYLPLLLKRLFIKNLEKVKWQISSPRTIKWICMFGIWRCTALRVCSEVMLRRKLLINNFPIRAKIQMSSLIFSVCKVREELIITNIVKSNLSVKKTQPAIFEQYHGKQ